MSTEAEARVLPEVTMNDELAKAIQEAVSTADVKSLLIAEAERQLATKTALDESQAVAEKAAADKIAADKAAADAAAVAAQVFTRTEVIGGRSITFTAGSDSELDREVLNAYKVAYALREPEATATTVDPAEAARAAEAEVLAKTELERKFRANEISAADYIEQTGAMDKYLEKAGVSLESLQKVTQADQSAKVVNSWKSAAEAFKLTPAGLDWPGGDKNQELIGLKIAALGLTDADDKVAALNIAYAEMKRTGLYFPQGDAAPVVKETATVVKDGAASAVTDAAVTDAAVLAARVAAASKIQSMSSSVFGASSGTSGAPVTSPAVAAAKAIVPADATPQEIIRAYNEANLAAGINPDEAFKGLTRANVR